MRNLVVLLIVADHWGVLSPVRMANLAIFDYYGS
jgi:hypothetical protein